MHKSHPKVWLPGSEVINNVCILAFIYAIYVLNHIVSSVGPKLLVAMLQVPTACSCIFRAEKSAGAFHEPKLEVDNVPKSA